ncbi:4-N-acetylglucosaminyltransferase,Protein O-linked-mannose beta-1 [Trichinella pseudospiralis]
MQENPFSKPPPFIIGKGNLNVALAALESYCVKCNAFGSRQLSALLAKVGKSTKAAAAGLALLKQAVPSFPSRRNRFSSKQLQIIHWTQLYKGTHSTCTNETHQNYNVTAALVPQQLIEALMRAYSEETMTVSMLFHYDNIF